MFEKEIIKETVHEEVKFVSPTFIIMKSHAGVRLILNLKWLNSFVKYLMRIRYLRPYIV